MSLPLPRCELISDKVTGNQLRFLCKNKNKKIKWIISHPCWLTPDSGSFLLWSGWREWKWSRNSSWRVSSWTWGCDERMYLGKKQKIPARGHLGSLSGVARVVINSQIQVLRVLCMFLERASQDNARARNLQPRGREEAVSFKKIDRDCAFLLVLCLR